MSYKKVFLLITVLTLSATSAVMAGGRPMEATLAGSSEIPGPGDANGTGMASVKLNPGQEMVCVHLVVNNIETATAAHIHAGSAGVAGPVVITLPTPNAQGTSSGCVEASRDLILNILHYPDQYYINVHNAPYPAGAIRGQIEK